MVVKLHWRLKLQRKLSPLRRWIAEVRKRWEPKSPKPTIEQHHREWMRQWPTMNVVIKNEHFDSEFLKSLFFEDDEIQLLPPETTMEDIGFLLGLFPSKGQARKAGWRGEIPNGWTDKRGLGKMKKSLFIWKPIEFKDED